MSIDIQLLALLCGHILGDFALQSDRLVARKGESTGWLLLHGAQVAGITWLLLGTWSGWWLAIILAAVHVLIDRMKMAADGRWRGNDRKLRHFTVDQLGHLVSTLVIWKVFFHEGQPISHNGWQGIWGEEYTTGLIVLTGLAVTVPVIGVVMKFQMADFAELLEASRQQGLPRGGKTIGMLERFLVFVFVLAGKPEGVGFVIAAKSVFRIGDLTRQEERDHAEYIMIGTLRSFAYALAAAFVTRWLLDKI